MRSALQITQDAMNDLLDRGDGVEFIVSDDAQILREAGALVLGNFPLEDGTYRVDLTFRGVPFATIADEPWA